MNNTSSLHLLLLFFSVCVSALTAAPTTIHYQGRLTDTSGTTLANANHSISINLYATELDEAILYTQSFTDIASDENGLYSIEIGDSSLVSILEGNDNLWLELSVNGETLSPRQSIHSVPYALHAESANRLLNATDSNISGTLSVSGNTSLAGNAVIYNDLDVWNRVTASEVRVDGHLDVMGQASIYDLNVGYSANFENVQEVLVPTPNQPNEAANKAYVDTVITDEASARTSAINALLADVALNEADADTAIALLQSTADEASRNWLVDFGLTTHQSDLSNVYIVRGYDSIAGELYSCEVGDTVLLTSQNDASQNGIYEIASFSHDVHAAKYGSLIRSERYDSSEEINSGDFILIEKGSAAGFAFMLGTLSDTFVLGTDDLNWYASGLSLQQEIHQEKFEREQAIENLETIVFENYNITYENSERVENNRAEAAYNLSAQAAALTTLIVELQADVDQNEANVDSLVSTAIANNNARGVVQLAITDNVSDISAYELTYQGSDGVVNPIVGDLILLTGQTSATENGIYAVASVDLLPSYQGNSPTAYDYTVSLARASNFDSADEFITGSFVFVEKGSFVGQGYVLGELANDFALGTSAINYTSFTIDKTQDVSFDQQVSANSLTSSGDLSVTGNTALSGNVNVNNSLSVMGTADFGMSNSVLVPMPDQPYEATNKAYVDSAITTLQSDVDQNESDADAAIAAEATARASAITAATTGDISANSLTTSGTLSVSGNTSLAGNTVIYNDLEVGNRVTASEVRVDGHLDVMGQATISNTMIYDLNVAYRANFEYAQEVRVPMPDHPDEATNKAYVDSVVVPSGGLIAWPVANTIPAGWSNPGLATPMVDHIWIQKN